MPNYTKSNLKGITFCWCKSRYLLLLFRLWSWSAETTIRSKTATSLLLTQCPSSEMGPSGSIGTMNTSSWYIHSPVFGSGQIFAGHNFEERFCHQTTSLFWSAVDISESTESQIEFEKKKQKILRKYACRKLLVRDTTSKALLMWGLMTDRTSKIIEHSSVWPGVQTKK